MSKELLIRAQFGAEIAKREAAMPDLGGFQLKPTILPSATAISSLEADILNGCINGEFQIVLTTCRAGLEALQRLGPKMDTVLRRVDRFTRTPELPRAFTACYVGAPDLGLVRDFASVLNLVAVPCGKNSAEWTKLAIGNFTFSSMDADGDSPEEVAAKIVNSAIPYAQFDAEAIMHQFKPDGVEPLRVRAHSTIGTVKPRAKRK